MTYPSEELDMLLLGGGMWTAKMNGDFLEWDHDLGERLTFLEHQTRNQI